MPVSFDPQHTSSAFVRARLDGRAISAFPGKVPDDIESAYAVQRQAIASWPDEVRGWKVGGVPPHFRKDVGTDRLAGPIFSREVRFQNGGPTQMPVFEGGFAAVEAEFVLKVGEDIPPGAVDPDAADLFRLVPEMFIGIEVASSPLPTINDLGPMVIVSDFGNNAGLVVGKPVPGWPEIAIDRHPVTVTIDGERAGMAAAPSLEAGPMGAFRFLLRNMASRSMTLPKGTLISTGAVTGVHQCKAGSEATAAFEGIGAIDVALVKAEPRSF